ncbi:hypothetical protein [Streptomyces atriruber]
MPAVPALVRGLLTAVSRLTSPLTPDDYLGLVPPSMPASRWGG